MPPKKKTQKRSGGPRRPFKALVVSVGSVAGGILSSVWHFTTESLRSVLPGNATHQIRMRKLFKR